MAQPELDTTGAPLTTNDGSFATNGYGLLQIAFLTTGGSIDKSYSPSSSSFEIEDPIIKDILHDGQVQFKYCIKSILKKDSLEMTDDDRMQVRQAVGKCTKKKIIITHGTDTLVETGRNLMGFPDKVIVLTGAFKPMRLKRTDAVLNLGMAIAAVQTLDPGVYVAINGTVSPVVGVEKDRENQVFRFLPNRNGNGQPTAKAHAAVRARHR
jgi:L-asparaginase